MPFSVKRKLFAHTACVESVDYHPTAPWLITSRYAGIVEIYDLQSEIIIHTFKIDNVRCVKFIAHKNWFVAGTRDGQIHVFNYNTEEKVISFQAHRDYIRCIAVQPTATILLTGCDDTTIKAWDWRKQWRNVHTYRGHRYSIASIAFNPKASSDFVSASFDDTIKIWSIGSPTANFTIKAHDDTVKYAEFYPGSEKPYLITAGHDGTIKIWSYHSNSCVQTIKAHSDKISFAVFHPNLPIIISGSEDRSVKIWNSETYEIEHTLNYELADAWCIAIRKGTNEVAVGFNQGIITLELGDHGSTMSKDHSGESHGDHKVDKITNPPTQHLDVDQSQHTVQFTRRRQLDSEGSDSEVRQEAELYQQCTALVMEIMATKITNDFISELTNEKAQDMADFLSKMVKDEDNITRRERKYTLHFLSKLAKIASVFPQTLELEGVQCSLSDPVTAGGYGFIYKGVHEGTPICVKAVRVSSEGTIDKKKMRAQAGELIIWAHMKHPNVLPFRGIYLSKEASPRVCIVSPWMKNGDLAQYLRKVPQVPRKPLVCDVISGLQYLHDFEIVHADLKAENVLVSETGRALLADFGISRLSMTQTTAMTNVGTGTVCWMAPELLLEGKPASCESDIWAFACTCYEIITGAIPFSQYRSVALLIAAFSRGDIIPAKPAPVVGWDEDVWSVATRCWQSDPASRPRAGELLDMFSSSTEFQKSGAKTDYNRILSILNEIRQLFL